MDDNQYASIDEMKQHAKPAPGPAEQLELEEAPASSATPPASRKLDESSQLQPSLDPPPLPPPNKPQSRSPPLTSPRPVSDGSMCIPRSECAATTDGVAAAGEEAAALHTSSSSPHLSSMASSADQTSPPTKEEQVDGRGGGGRGEGGGDTPIYAVVKKPKKSPDSKPATPPPLPPPLVLGEGDSIMSGGGTVLVPQHGNETEAKPRRPVPLPRAHVYEVVPDNAIVQEQQQPSPSLSKSSSRKSQKKKKKGNKYKQKSGDKTFKPLISLNDLEPLPSSGKSMKLLEFMNRFSHYLPLRVKVEEGYCGTEERFVISSGDVYNFHFVKTEKVASIRDCGGSTFSIPLNSAIEFGTLYNPSNDFKTALKGYVFKSVSELASCKQLPRVICATRAHLTGDSRSSVKLDEILVVRKISRTTVMRKPVLKGYSPKTNEDKLLQEDCEAHFSTRPDLLKLYLPEILEHFSASFPLDTMMYMRSSEPSEDLPLHLTSDVVTLSHMTIESSIIASTCWEYEQQGELSEEDQALVAIPIDLDIEVTFLGRESDDEELYASTRSYFEKFRSLKITDMKNSGGMQRAEGVTLAQKKLYKAVREGYEAKSTEIKMPYRISGVFDGELSPMARSFNHSSVLPVPEVREEDVAPSLLPSHSPHSRTTITTTNPYIEHSLAAHPGPTPHPGHAPSFPVPPPPSDDHLEEDLLNGELGALYSAIDEIFDSTLQNSAKSADPRPRPEGASSATSQGSPPQDRKSAAVSARAGSADSAPQVPKPYPRARSQMELKSSRSGDQEGGFHGDHRVLGVEELSKNYTELQLEFRELKAQLELTRELEAGYDVVQPPSLRVRTMPRSAQRPVSIVKASNMEDQQRNKEELRNLDHREIISLLSCMNLEQYKEEFMREQVDGEILAECDEIMLEKELHIASAIHRTRLLKVISGRHSALGFLREGTDLYSTLDHRYSHHHIT